jgi:hypothetical protein
MNENVFLSKERADAGSTHRIRTEQFAAAYNAKDYDLVCALIAPESRRRILKSIWLGCDLDDLRQFFDALYQLYGKLHHGRIRTDQGGLQNVLCWENGRWIRLLFDQDCRVAAIDFQPQGKSTAPELTVLDEAPAQHPLNTYPPLADIRFLPSSEDARFCLRVEFENGEKKLCRFPCAEEADEVARIGGYCFTDRIFRSGRIAEAEPKSRKYRPGDMPPRGQRVAFINGFFISAAELYFDGIQTE